MIALYPGRVIKSILAPLHRREYGTRSKVLTRDPTRRHPIRIKSVTQNILAVCVLTLKILPYASSTQWIVEEDSCRALPPSGSSWLVAARCSIVSDDSLFISISSSLCIRTSSNCLQFSQTATTALCPMPRPTVGPWLQFPHEPDSQNKNSVTVSIFETVWSRSHAINFSIPIKEHSPLPLVWNDPEYMNTSQEYISYKCSTKLASRRVDCTQFRIPWFTRDVRSQGVISVSSWATPSPDYLRRLLFKIGKPTNC